MDYDITITEHFASRMVEVKGPLGVVYVPYHKYAVLKDRCIREITDNNRYRMYIGLLKNNLEVVK